MRKRRVILDKDILDKLYTEEKLSIVQTADRLNVSCHAVSRNLQDHGILIRPTENFTRSRLTAELLKTLYIDKNLTAAKIADRLGHSPLTIAKNYRGSELEKLFPPEMSHRFLPASRENIRRTSPFAETARIPFCPSRLRP